MTLYHFRTGQWVKIAVPTKIYLPLRVSGNIKLYEKAKVIPLMDITKTSSFTLQLALNADAPGWSEIMMYTDQHGTIEGDTDTVVVCEHENYLDECGPCSFASQITSGARP